MSEVLQANIFFVIASIATVLFCIGVCFILYQVFKILKTVRNILDQIETATDAVADDIANVRKFMSAGGGVVPVILSLIFGSAAAKRKGRTTRSSDD